MAETEKKYLVSTRASKKIKKLVAHDGTPDVGRRKTDYNYALIGMWGNIMPMLLASSLSGSYPWVFFVSLPIQLATIVWMGKSFLQASTKRQRLFQKAKKLELIVEVPPKLLEIYSQQCEQISVDPSVANLQNEFAVVKEQLLPALAELEGCGPRDAETRDHMQHYLEQQLGRIAEGQRIELQDQERRREIEAQEARRREQDAASDRLTRAQTMFPLDEE